MANPATKPADPGPSVALTLRDPASPWPKVRHAMILVLPPKAGAKSAVRVSVTETRDGGILTIQDGIIDRSADLSVLELRFLAQFCNRIARRVATRGARP